MRIPFKQGASLLLKLESKLLPGVDMYTERPGAGIIPKRKGGEETPMSNIDEMLDLLETCKPKLSGRAKKLYDKLVKLKEKAEKINEEFDKKIDEAIEKLDYAEEKLTIAIEVLRAVEKRLNEGKQMGLIMHTGDSAIIFDDGSLFDPTGSLAPVNSNDTIYFDKK